MSNNQNPAAIAGMSDAAVRAKTERDWGEWVRALDADGVADLGHGQIAAHVQERYGLSGWWAQTVTVGYERIRGLRAIGQRRGTGRYQASKSKTFQVSVSRLYAAFADPAERARWLPDVDMSIRTAKADRSMRIGWPDGTSVQIWFTAKGPSKAQVAIQHADLAGNADRDDRKTYWAERLEALADHLRSAAVHR